MKNIANNNFYELSYDEKSNLVYWTMKGYWNSLNVVPDFEKDWDTAVSETRKGYRVFADLHDLEKIPDHMKEVHFNKQKTLLDNGCEKIACMIGNSIACINCSNKFLMASIANFNHNTKTPLC